MNARGIRFESSTATLTILNPFAGFAAEEHRIEVRRDPLLGDTSVLNPSLAGKTGFFGENDPELVRRLVEDSAKTCIFCGESLLTKTARYPEELVPGGRIVSGEATLLPNLFALGAYHPLVVLGTTHFLKLSEFTPRLLADGLGAAREFLRRVYRRDETALFATVNANYLFPAGASIVHPHLQMLVTALPYSRQARMLAAGERYLEQHGTAYHEDLIGEERRLGSRYGAQTGGWHWIAAWSPIGGNEIQAVHESECDFGNLADTDLRELAGGIARVLALYESLGHLSFNYSLFSVRRGDRASGARCVFTIVNRQALSANYRNDDYFLQKLLQTELIVTLPEELGKKVRAVFKG